MQPEARTTISIRKSQHEELRRVQLTLSLSRSERITMEKVVDHLLKLYRAVEIVEDPIESLDLVRKMVERVEKKLNERIIEEYSCNPGLYRKYDVYEEYDLCIDDMKIVVRFNGFDNTYKIVSITFGENHA